MNPCTRRLNCRGAAPDAPDCPWVTSAEVTVSPGRPGCVGGGEGAHLGLGEHERGGHLEALGPRQVLVELELMLQLQQLLAGEGGARPAALPQEVRLRLGWGPKGNEAHSRLRSSPQPLPWLLVPLPSRPQCRRPGPAEGQGCSLTISAHSPRNEDSGPPSGNGRFGVNKTFFFFFVWETSECPC